MPEFWKNLKPGFRKEIQLFHLLYRGDGVIGLEDIRPLYDYLGLDDENGKYPHRICDLKHIYVHLIKTANEGGNKDNCQRLAIIHSIAEAIGRGGEVKFQTFRDWFFDYLWNVTNTPWKEKKTIQGYAMARVADEMWYKDWYCSMGMLFQLLMHSGRLTRLLRGYSWIKSSPVILKDSWMEVIFVSLRKLSLRRY